MNCHVSGTIAHVSLTYSVGVIFFLGRLNKEPPNITFRKKEKGGINLQTTVCIETQNL